MCFGVILLNGLQAGKASAGLPAAVSLWGGGVLKQPNQPTFPSPLPPFSPGYDDMPAHCKASLMGSSVTLPVTRGAFAVGTWQGIYLCEHHDRGTPRSLVVTITGEFD